MSTHRIWSSVIVLAVTAGWSTSFQRTEGLPSVASHIPTLSNTCLITNDVKRLVDFYEPILALKAKWSSKDYAEFPTGAGVLAIFSEEAQEDYIPGSTEAAKNKSMVLEFRVGDVDQEYRRLQSFVKTWVKPPNRGEPVPFTSVTRTEILSIFIRHPKLYNERPNHPPAACLDMPIACDCWNSRWITSEPVAIRRGKN